MKTIKIRGQEFTTCSKWEDLSTGTYIDLMILYSKVNEIDEEQFLVDFITVISGIDKKFIMSLYEDELEDFVKIFTDFNKNPFKSKELSAYTIDGVLYSYDKVDKLTLGEKISIKMLQKDAKTDFDGWLDILAILIRPAEEFISTTKKKDYKIEDFNDDMEVLTYRKELFKQLPAVNTMKIIEAFIPGRIK